MKKYVCDVCGYVHKKELELKKHIFPFFLLVGITPRELLAHTHPLYTALLWNASCHDTCCIKPSGYRTTETHSDRSRSAVSASLCGEHLLPD